MDCLDNTQAKYIYELADDDTQANILMEVDEKVRDEFIASLSNKEIAEQLENLESDDAADLLKETFPEISKRMSSLKWMMMKLQKLLIFLNMTKTPLEGLCKKNLFV